MDEFEDYLRNELDESALPDREFTRGVMMRIERARTSRRVAFGVALAIALAIVATVVGFEISPGMVLGALLLITISSVAWIDGESVTGS